MPGSWWLEQPLLLQQALHWSTLSSAASNVSLTIFSFSAARCFRCHLLMFGTQNKKEAEKSITAKTMWPKSIIIGGVLINGGSLLGAGNVAGGSLHGDCRSVEEQSCIINWLARLDFPRLNGDGVKQWLIQCETFFSVDGTPDDYKVCLAVVHFEGKALQWHNTYIKNKGLLNLPSWESYTRILIDRFGEVGEDPMAELMRLRQKNFVEDYHDAFDRIVSQVELSEANQLSCFLDGLKQDV
ncbi:hypothetical protein V8G54_011878 [Vigna mungo]|uniref:Retrotransposon gag domain-containing protein n=1 Tax=Vigna mungo TaxID=3915 RepID=A0AAQ3S1N4_VIGMU